MNISTTHVYIRNIIDISIFILKYIKLKRIFDYEEKSYYYLNENDIYLIIEISWKYKATIIVLIITIISIES